MSGSTRQGIELAFSVLAEAAKYAPDVLKAVLDSPNAETFVEWVAKLPPTSVPTKSRKAIDKLRARAKGGGR